MKARLEDRPMVLRIEMSYGEAINLRDHIAATPRGELDNMPVVVSDFLTESWTTLDRVLPASAPARMP